MTITTPDDNNDDDDDFDYNHKYSLEQQQSIGKRKTKISSELEKMLIEAGVGIKMINPLHGKRIPEERSDGTKDAGGYKLPIEAFAREIYQDMPALIVASPGGVSIDIMEDYYGETPSRIRKALKILLDENRIEAYRTSSARNYYRLPENSGNEVSRREIRADALNVLGGLQFRIAAYLVDICLKVSPTCRTVKTNYSHIERQVCASSGGVKYAMTALENSGLVTVLHRTPKGIQAYVMLRLSDKLFDMKKTLDSHNSNNV